MPGKTRGTVPMAFHFSPRRTLVIAHDLVMTAAAVVASFYIRFEAAGLAEREEPLLLFLPGFVAYAGVVYYLFHLYEAKWRFASLPDLMNILRAVDGARGVAAGARLRAGRAQRARAVLLRQDHHRALLGPADASSSAGRGSPIAISATRAPGITPAPRPPIPTLVLGRAADAEVLLRAIESGAVKKIWPVGMLSPSPADQGQSIRGIPVLGDFDELDAVVNDFAQRDTAISRVIFTPSAFEPDAKPEATLMHARRLGLAVSRLPSLDDGGEMPRLAPVNVEDLLLRPSVKIDYARLETFLNGKSVVVTGGGGSIGAEICDRVVDLRRGAAADHREFRAGAACGARKRSPPSRSRPRDRRPHRRRARPRPRVPADGGVQARHRLPCRGAQARAAA